MLWKCSRNWRYCNNLNILDAWSEQCPGSTFTISHPTSCIIIRSELIKRTLGGRLLGISKTMRLHRYSLSCDMFSRSPTPSYAIPHIVREGILRCTSTFTLGCLTTCRPGCENDYNDLPTSKLLTRTCQNTEEQRAHLWRTFAGVKPSHS